MRVPAYELPLPAPGVRHKRVDLIWEFLVCEKLTQENKGRQLHSVVSIETRALNNFDRLSRSLERRSRRETSPIFGAKIERAMTPAQTALPSPAARLKALLARDTILIMPGCHDAMSARLIEAAGFEIGFMSGFAVSADRLGMPDTGLISYAELADQGQNICRAVSIPLIGDGDTGFGSAQNIKRTVQGYAHAGFAAIMLEDQIAPKRCGHTEGKSVVGRDEALTRVRAAVDARNAGTEILIMARTDARAILGLDEAIARCQAFRALGADITFLEAPVSEEEMRRYCVEVDGPKMANLIEGGKTPLLSPSRLQQIGYSIAVYPLTLLNVSIAAMRSALESLKRGETPASLMNFDELKQAVGFPEYYAEEARYRSL